MSRKKRNTLFLLLSPLLAVIIFLGIEVICGLGNIIPPWHKSSSIEITLSWGGLNKLPKDSTNIDIKTRGSAFTRQFYLTFNSAITNWISGSKRLQNNIPEISGEIHQYKIYPGEQGAIGGYVEINIKTWHVFVDMSWS